MRVVPVYHPRRYNTSAASLGGGGCAQAPCSHLCLSVPGGRRCACPDRGLDDKRTSERACDAGQYPATTCRLPLRLRVHHWNYNNSKYAFN